MNRSPRRPGDPLLGVSWQRLTTKQGALASIKSDFFGGGGGHLYFFYYYNVIILLLYIYIFYTIIYTKIYTCGLEFPGAKSSSLA